MVKKSLFDEYGLFKTAFHSGNDIEWSQRHVDRGRDIGYCHEMVVDYPTKTFHQLRGDMKKYAKGLAHLKEYRLGHLWTDMVRAHFPMRPSTFNENLTYRGWTRLSHGTKFTLWIYIWLCKITYGQALIRSYFLSWLKRVPD